MLFEICYYLLGSSDGRCVGGKKFKSKFVKHFCARNRRDIGDRDITQEAGVSVQRGFLNPPKIRVLYFALTLDDFVGKF